MTELSTDRLLRATAALLKASGVPNSKAEATATAIVRAEQWGIASHGLLRIPSYLLRLAEGGINPRADLVRMHATRSVIAYDGQGGLGHWQMWVGAKQAVRLAARGGIGMVAIGNSSHCGALGVYAASMRDAGYAGIVFSNGPAAMPAWNGSRAIVSTSPIAVSVPSGSGGAIVDLASSAVTRGRIAKFARDGRPLEPGWAYDQAGRPTVDPDVALKGMVAPIGGPKGFALAYAVEALTGGLIGPVLSTSVVDPFDEGRAAEPQRVSHLLIAIRPSSIDLNGQHNIRLLGLEADVVSSGGRVPGSRRRDMAPAPLPVDDALRSELLAWAQRLKCRAAERALTGSS